jgi:hypothetical protein
LALSVATAAVDFHAASQPFFSRGASARVLLQSIVSAHSSFLFLRRKRLVICAF